jgi:hypothetical protein
MSFNATSQAAPSASAGGADDDEEGEGEPILAPEAVLRNQDDKDELLHELECKLLRYDTASKEWKDMGKGTFRVTKCFENNKQRMLMRNLTGKVMFNAGFHKGIKFERAKNQIKFSAVVAVDGKGSDGAATSKSEMRMFSLKMKAQEDLITTTLAKLNNGAQSVS